MKYMGSKNRHAKEILPIILKNRQKDQWYVEPFVGGFNIIDKVNGNRIASDSNNYLIKLFQAICHGWIPPSEISEKQYNEIKNNKEDYDVFLVGFVGFGCSYSGKWFGGYARGNDVKGNPRNYCEESKKNILKQKDKILDIGITCCNYQDLYIPPKSIVYCDPPYANTTKYKDEFDSDEFWNWVRKLVKDGHEVFISEYVAPDDFIEIWSKKVNNTLDKDTGAKQGVEKLFKHRSQL